MNLNTSTNNITTGADQITSEIKTIQPMTPEQKKADELLNEANGLFPIEANFTDSVEEANRKILADHKATVRIAIWKVNGIIDTLGICNTPNLQIQSVTQAMEFYNNVLLILQGR